MANEHTTLSSLFTAIANAIRSKTGSSASIIADQFPDAISAIETGGGGITPTGTISITSNGTHDVTNYASAEVNVPTTGSGGIDTSGATATADDIAEGKTAYVSTGMVTGTLTTWNSGDNPTFYHTSYASYEIKNEKLQFNWKFPKSQVYRKDSIISIASDISNFGDATADDVAAGKTFTSAAGLKVTGTHEGNVEACGQYIWAKHQITKWGVTKTDLGTTKPSDCASTSYGTATITDDGYYTLSGSVVGLSKYHYITGSGTNPKSVYYESYSYPNTRYYLHTISDEPVNEVGDLIGYVVSDDEAAYPDGDTQDGYWYARVTVQEV